MERAELKEMRLNLGLTQVDLAERLKVSRITYVRWEHGKTRIPGMIEFALDAVRKQIEKDIAD